MASKKTKASAVKQLELPAGPTTLQDAISSLYKLTVVEKKSTSTKRLAVLARYCVEQLEMRGIKGVLPEQGIPGAGRSKAWDVGWSYDGKYRLGISLKSLLKNLCGPVIRSGLLSVKVAGPSYCAI